MLPWWATSLLTFLAEVVNQYLANRRAEEALRGLGAATQANTSLHEAERQEATARAAGDAVGSTPAPANDPDMRDD